jgi:TolB-like protein
MDFKKYVEELKRRKVFKAAIAYIASAWIIAQVTADVLPIFEIPAFIQQTIIIVLIIGFPAILIFAWVYDFTPKGIKKTEKSEHTGHIMNRKTRNLNLAIISLLSITILILLYNQFRAADSASGEDQIFVASNDALQNTIAVLPFKNWSGDRDLEYVSDGLADEITTKLQETEDFDKVVAFREALKFKYSDIGLQQISDSLDVRFILDGSMQLSGNLIRIKVQLLDGKTNKYFWGEEFTTSWDSKDLFFLQSEVTRRVLENIKEDVGDTQEVFAEQLPTENKEAYQFYLKGLYQLNKQSQQGVEASIEFFKKSIELDSNFIGAYKSLSNAYMYSGLYSGVNDPREAWNSSKIYLEKVQELSEDRSDLIWARLRMRFNSYVFDWNFDLMEQDYLAGFEDNSMLTKTLYELNTGRFEEALKTAKLKAEGNPTCGSCQVYLAHALFYLGRSAKAKDVVDQNFELFNDSYNFLREAAFLYYNIGDYNMSQETLRRIAATFNANTPDIQFLTAVNHEVNGDSGVAVKTVEILKEQYAKKNSGSPAWYLAKYYAHTGDYESTLAWLQKSFNRRDVEMIWLRTEPLFAPVRKDPRYLEIYKTVGFPVPPEIIPEGVSRKIQ